MPRHRVLASLARFILKYRWEIYAASLENIFVEEKQILKDPFKDVVRIPFCPFIFFVYTLSVYYTALENDEEEKETTHREYTILSEFIEYRRRCVLCVRAVYYK